MRVIVQRTTKASVTADGVLTGSIDKGFMLLIGFTHDDTIEEIKLLAKKVIGLRIFEDEFGKINKSLSDVNGAILAISQFTLYADCKKGNRPSFTTAMAFDKANDMYLKFCDVLKESGIKVEMGIFGADMKIDFINDGPVTIILDSKDLK